ncbi:MAG: DUF5107 domain-containing protein [Ardenticatenales bacterium]|nr:DUF5107 domain-containing protein [Ardenticatenales bacterium]
MSELRIETWTMPSADLGPENPLPPLASGRDLHAVESAPGIPGEMLRNMAYGRLSNALPYTMQDGYTRQLFPREFRVAVLENEILRATFLLELGGRLWSLVHKPSCRELLYVNPVFQPGNLALRNAWFAGGVEWNIGTIGHSPITCAPLFAARVDGSGGTPILRLYEYERFRGVPFQIDAYLPDESPVLLVRVRIINPHSHEVPMYWWSNIAAPESTDTRVVVPAESAYRFGYKGSGLIRIPVPQFEGVDYSYSTNVDHSADYFFHVPDGRRPWIAALDGEGKGLVETSTPRLKGRKLFLWGRGRGGREWQRFLSPAGGDYIEIQAGLARTQMEHLPMPAGAEWSWLEAYGLMEADPGVVHGAEWGQARQAVEGALGKLISRAALDAEFERGAEFADKTPAEMLQLGSGWGALERIRREAAGELSFCSEALVFDDESLSEAQTPWLGLLRDGAMPATDPDKAPRGYLVQAEWRAMLEEALHAGRGTNWLAWLHLGILRHYARDSEGARCAWELSLVQARTPWAMRNLAVLALEDEQFDDAVQLYVAAWRMAPTLMPLAVECGRALIEAGRPGEWLALLDKLPESLRFEGRIRLLEAQAALDAGEYEIVEQFFADQVVIADIREGEVSLSDLWFDLHARRLSVRESIPLDDALRARVRCEFPVPEGFDFRMDDTSHEDK